MKEKLKALHEKYYKQFNLKYPNLSLYDMIEKSAKKYPNNIAYNYFGKNSTYQKLIQDIEICAKSLKTLGIKKADVITICMPNTPEAIICFYAINKIGAIANMIHPLSAENEIKYYLDVSDSKMLITIDLAWKKIKKILPETKVEKTVVLSVKGAMPLSLKSMYTLTKERKIEKPLYNENILNWKSFLKQGERYTKNTNTHAKKDDTAVILYSGGTTGLSKGIILSNLNFNAIAIQNLAACPLKSTDKCLSIMPIFHGFGLGICIHTIFYLGATAIMQPSFNAKEFGKLLRKYKPNIIAGVPTLYEALLNSKEKNLDLSCVTCCVSGGDKLSPELKYRVDKFLKEHNSNTEIREGYGLTECVTASCLTPIGNYREGSIGIPYPDIYYKIVKIGTCEEVPFYEDGEIVITGTTVMKRILKK